MKNLSFSAAICALTLVSAPSDAAPKLLNGIKAKVNGEAITQVDLDEAVKVQAARLFQSGGITSSAQAEREMRKLEEQALNDLIDRKLILSEFKTRGGTIQKKFVDNAVNDFVQSRFGGDRSKFLSSLEEQGISLNQFRKTQEERIAVQALQGQLARPGDNLVMPHERKPIYDEIKHEYKGEGTVRMQMITIPKLKPGRTKQQQKDLIHKLHKRIANGTAFSTVAKDYSLDQFAASGGFVTVKGQRDLNPNSFSPEIAKNLKRLGLERVSPVIEDGLAWRLVMVNARKSGSVPSQKELDSVIENRLLAKKRRASLDAWLKKLRRDSNVQIY